MEAEAYRWQTLQTSRAPGGQVEAVDGGRPVGLLGPWAGTGRFGGSAEAEAAFDRGVLGTAAQLVGLGRRMVDLHLYLKRAEALARSWGDAAWHRRRVAKVLGL